MDDRQLLEDAATAAGLNVLPHLNAAGEWVDGVSEFYLVTDSGRPKRKWNPLTDDGDEARLEAALQLHVTWDPLTETVNVGTEEGICIEPWLDDKQKARRRAGVRAAAAIGAALTSSAP